MERYITTCVRFPPDNWLEGLLDYLSVHLDGGWYSATPTLTKAINRAAKLRHDTIITVVI